MDSRKDWDWEPVYTFRVDFESERISPGYYDSLQEAKEAAGTLCAQGYGPATIQKFRLDEDDDLILPADETYRVDVVLELVARPIKP